MTFSSPQGVTVHQRHVKLPMSPDGSVTLDPTAGKLRIAVGPGGSGVHVEDLSRDQ